MRLAEEIDHAGQRPGFGQEELELRQLSAAHRLVLLNEHRRFRKRLSRCGFLFRVLQRLRQRREFSFEFSYARRQFCLPIVRRWVE